MIVLGLHGWDGMHDAAAALVVDGEAVAFVEEERLSRRKHALSARPSLAARAVLHQAGLGWDDVDVVAYGWDLPRYLVGHGRRFDFTDDGDFLARALEIRARCMPRLAWVDHHDAHAAASFFSSGFREAAVLVVDGQGEERSISLYAADGRGLRRLRTWPPACSLGFLYQAATLYCGFGWLDAGKTMGLAPYAPRPADPLPLVWEGDDLRSPLAPELEEDAAVAAWGRLLVERFGRRPHAESVFDSHTSGLRWRREGVVPHHPDVAAAAQEAVERLMVELVQYAQRETGCSRVALAGGVALNCVANGIASAHCEALFVPPSAHDAGSALGAALLAAHESGDTVRPVARADLGIGYSADEIEAVVARSRLRARRVDDPGAEGARRLVEGQVIGWFQGRGEAGPRALGHRSILALPAVEGNRDRVNRIKGRELWRPLAPSALCGEMEWMFGRALDSPYMLRSIPLTVEARGRVPAVAHVDGSTRVQTVEHGGGTYARLLEEVRRETGHGVVMNTSFNAPGEPIVCSPADAIRTFSTMGLDALVLGHVVLEKDG
jgi:carbamoyltransferase